MRPNARVFRPRFLSGMAISFLTLLLATAPPVVAQAPDEAWRTLETEHFRVHFPATLEPLARRAAERSERAYALLESQFLEPPDGATDVIVTDHVDVSNGFATVAPWKRITIYARPPVDDAGLQYFDDWLELVITHELAHVFHLDLGGPLAKLMRGVFGRYPGSWPVFPERSLPDWTIEGLATYYESALTDAGRVHGSYHHMIVRTAALERALETLDQVSGDSPLWPGGTRPYVFGGRFFEHMTIKHGRPSMGRFANTVARQWIPYRLNKASITAFGATMEDEWSDWLGATRATADSLVGRLVAKRPLTRTELVDQSGRFTLYPTVAPDGRSVVAAHSDGRSDTQLRSHPLGAGDPVELTRTNGLSTFAFAPNGAVVFAQLERAGPWRTWNDLYWLDPHGATRRITHEARVSHPTVSPTGNRIVAVQEGGGGNRLVAVDPATGATVPLTRDDIDELWSFPRFSPDGKWLAAVRWLPGGHYDVVVLDSIGRLVVTVTNDRAVDQAPTWAPDGRTLLWSSDRTGIPNVFAASFDPSSAQVGPIHQVTNAAAGYAFPSVAPRGDWIYVAAYHADGWHIERLPFEPESWFEPFPTEPRFLDGGGAAADRIREMSEAPVRPYRAIRSLLPRYWEPEYRSDETIQDVTVLGPAFGLTVEGRDLVDRHRFTANLLYEPDGGRFDGGLDYEFAGLGVPTLGISLRQFHDAAALQGTLPDSTVVPLFVVERERRAFASVDIVQPRFRRFLALTLSGGLVRERRELLESDLEPTDRFRLSLEDRTSVEARATLSISTARAYAFSVSAEEGVSAFISARGRETTGLADSLQSRPGVDRSLNDVTGRFRAYKGFRGPGFGNHVVGLQVSGGAARGPGADAFHFDVGGASGRPESISGFGLFGGSALLFPVRGYRRTARSGRYAWSASAEYRFPIARVHRGLGAFPLYFDRISGSIFSDFGNAWGGEDGRPNPRRTTLRSVGAELTATVLPLWTSVITVRTGFGVPLTDGAGTMAYVRVGTSF